MGLQHHLIVCWLHTRDLAPGLAMFVGLLRGGSGSHVSSVDMAEADASVCLKLVYLSLT